MLGKYLNIKKNELGLTNQEISNLSGVPKSTVDRILRSEDCASTNLITAVDLVKAIGGSLDEAMGISQPLRLTPEDVPDDAPGIISRVCELVDKVQRMHHAVHREKDAIAAESVRFRTRVLIGSLLVNNFVMNKFLGICPFLGVSKKFETSMGMGMAVTFVMTMASFVTWLVNTYLLLPFNLFATYYFQALMKANLSVVASIARGAVISGTMILWLPAAFGPGSIWYAMLITEALVAAFSAYYMARCTRQLE